MQDNVCCFLNCCSFHACMLWVLGSISDALQEVSGVRFLRTGASIAKPLINGMHSNRVSIINDDCKQEGQQWGREHARLMVDPCSLIKMEILLSMRGQYICPIFYP